MNEPYLTEEYLTEAFTNPTFDVESTELALRKSLDNSFPYLYRLQRNLVQYEEYHYTTRNIVETPEYGDMWLNAKDHVCINFDVEVIPVQDKKIYKDSKFFKKEITLKELITNKEVFHRLPILYIDGKIIRDFSIRISEGAFTIITKFGRNFLHEKQWDPNVYNLNGTLGNNVYREHEICLQIIPNSSVFDFATNTAMLQRNSYDKESFDRVMKDYLDAFVENREEKTDGTYFAILFKGKEEMGSSLQDVTLDENEDFVIHWDKKTLEELQKNGSITIRFIFFRYLQKYSWEKDHKKIDYLEVRKKGEEYQSELALIWNHTLEKRSTYAMPIPVENCFLFKKNEEESILFDQKNLKMYYPNLYYVDTNIEEEEKLHLYYFYIPGYDLHYEHRYWWFYQYMYIKWGKPNELTIEEVVNQIEFEDIDVESTLAPIPVIDEIDEKQEYDYYIPHMELRDTLVHNRWNEYAGDSVEIGNESWRDYVKEARWPNSSLMISNYITMCTLRFHKVFTDVCHSGWIDYQYDDIDYLKNFKEDLTPLEYKVYKLKYFISDDMRCLHDYEIIQNKTSIKYHFVSDKKQLESRLRVRSEVHDHDLGEPMYLFTFEKKHSKDFLSCRIFIDGLMFSNFIRESHGFTDFVYIPERALIDDCDIDIEIFPTLYKKYEITFDSTDDAVWLDFPSPGDIIATISDIVFYNEENLYNTFSHDNFQFSVLTDRYNYRLSEEKVRGYALVENFSYKESIYYDNLTNEYYKLYANGEVEHFNANNESLGFLPFNEMPQNLVNINQLGSKLNRGKGYYDNLGRHFTAEGQPDFKNSIPIFLLEQMLENGTLEGIDVYPTWNEMIIEPDSDYIDYRDVINGSSIIDPKNKGINNTKATRIGIRLLNKELVGQKIWIKVEKDSGYIVRQFDRSEYPQVPLNLINPYTADEFIRVFHNGKLLSKRLYAFITNLKNPRIYSLKEFEKNDEIFAEITPYRNRLIYHVSELSSYLIDLRGYIEKPFDLRYYDVYLNGRKLGERNIYPITGWMFLLGGCHSIYNLDIYERDRDWEYYGTNWGKYYTVGDLVNEVFMEPWIKKELIDSLFPSPPPLNDNCEEKEEYDSDMSLNRLFFEMYYFERLLPLGLATGDQQQFDEVDIAGNYPAISEKYMVENDFGEKVILHNPDWYIESEDAKSFDVNRWHIYMLGNNYDTLNQRIPITTDIGKYGIYVDVLSKEMKELP